MKIYLKFTVFFIITHFVGNRLISSLYTRWWDYFTICKSLKIHNKNENPKYTTLSEQFQNLIEKSQKQRQN